MIKRILALLGLLLFFHIAYAINPGDRILGKWKVIQVLDSSAIAEMSDEQAKRALGKYLVIDKKAVRFQEEIGLLPTFTESKQNTFDYFYHGYRMDPVNLHLPETVTEIRINYKNSIDVYAVYPKNKNSIIFYWRGFFYKAIRSR
ncbi:hypothetical protein [Paraherbaspirillum soli]|uniref:DUF2147 domain-containing protein n=1 Tax=Paraherbaspirillum soli TaxID=631222 RepID=A0ABW0MA59_9BURK